MTGSTVLASIEEKYAYDDEEYGDFIVFVSSSPECKKGMFPPVMTLCDYDIEAIGSNGINVSRLSHIVELDLTDNLLSEWSEIFLLLKMFPGLEFLNLSNNLLSEPIAAADLDNTALGMLKRPLKMKKLVLNGNRVDWSTMDVLLRHMPDMEQLYLCANNLHNPTEDTRLAHANLKQLFLSCNPLSSFDALASNVAANCPCLQLLSLAECPIDSIPDEADKMMSQLQSLNLSTTKIADWNQVDKLRKFPTLRELRLQRCPLLVDHTAHERRMLLVARLPNVQILNGGDVIPANEREDAERAFIRFFLDSAEDARPKRYDELVTVHGRLDPLVSIDMRPSTLVKVKISHKEALREEVIKVYQTVQQFKALLHQWFSVPPQNQKVYYCDKDLVNMAGPEEMKWPQKELYTYNVQNGDKFILDEKVSLGRLRSRNTSTCSLGSSSGSPNYKLGIDGKGSSPRIAFSLSPKPILQTKSSPRLTASRVARSLFKDNQQDEQLNENRNE